MPRAIFLLVSVAVLALLPPLAAADRPTRERFPNSGFELGPDVCGFPVAIAVEVDREYLTTFSDGRQLLTGALKVSATNLDTGSRLVVNASGPGTLSAAGDVVTYDARGRWLLVLGHGDPGGPGLFVYSGHTLFTFDQTTFATTILSESGNREDVCAALA